jgi:lysozyme family protein
MPNVPLTAALRKEYERLFNSCIILANEADEVSSILKQIEASRPRYEAVEKALGVPWFFTAVIHNMESSLSFKSHLHNGDSLRDRTHNVPAGRPKSGNPPFSWEESATDALTMKGLSAQTEWSLPGTLYQLERYNGWGYRLYHPHVLSPYLWSFSNHYSGGKYVSDGTWSETAKSSQCGAAVLLRRMAELNSFTFAGEEPHPRRTEPLISYSTKLPKDPETIEQVKGLQAHLNLHRGIFVKVDGIPGRRTSDAFRLVFGHYLTGDPRR